MGKGKINLAIFGAGNCASSLVQGIYYYRDLDSKGELNGAVGILHPDIGGYKPGDIDVVAAVDIDARKVGKKLNEALVALPNNTKIFYELPKIPVEVIRGNVLDGFAEHMREYPERQRFVIAKGEDLSLGDAITYLRDNKADVAVNYMPVGSQRATEFYASVCLGAGVSLVNCMPVFIASSPFWGSQFKERGIPVVGDDIKAQVGATIVHRVLARLFNDRGVRIDNTYQLNTGGNTDFLNMLARNRLASKKISKTEAVQSQLNIPLHEDNIHIGPSDFVPWQKDNKICFLRIEGRGFGGVPMNLELRLSVEDSPNSGGESIDAIRCAKLAMERGLSGPLLEVSAYTMKHPPKQYSDSEALKLLDDFIRGK